MIHGMTGYGRGERSTSGVSVTIDVRTVNHRYLDVDVRGGALPGDLAARVRKLVGARLSRGKVEVLVGLHALEARAASLRVDRGAVRAMVEALTELAKELRVAEPVKLEHLALLPWSRALETVAPELDEAEEDAVLAAVDAALDEVVAARRREGSETRADLEGRLATLRELLGRVRSAVTDLVKAQHERLRARLGELAADVTIAPERLAQEAALLAERSDVAEEVTRFGAWLDRLDQLSVGDGPVGKTLDFTLQEALREVNTIGSKARDLAVGETVIAMKAELERMREQAANLE